MNHHNQLWAVTQRLDGDYTPYGKLERWADPGQSYPDCSCGCIFFYALANRGNESLGSDWGVCANIDSHRRGLLTFEHQGCQKFTAKRKPRTALTGGA